MCLCAFATKKSSYVRNMLKVLNAKLEQPPLSITSDFERAFLNASAKIFNNVKHFGCFFHFKQAMWRKIQALSLVSAYKDNAHLHLKMPQALAFLPINDVVPVFELLKQEMPSELTEFYAYVESTYIQNIVEVKPRGRNAANRPVIRESRPPLFDISLWNVHARFGENIPRTNNFVEAWNRAFSVLYFSVFYLYLLQY